MAGIVSDKKKALMALKEKLLKELEYYNDKIKYVRVNNNNYMDDDSSDSDTGLPILDLGPSVAELKMEKAKLKTCLQATQELTNLQVLQSEVNIMVEDPVLDGEQSVSEAGTWQEVTAECRINFLPFSIMFYCHKPSAMYGPRSYRGVRVSALKATHEAELGDSVLASADTPANAIQVLRSYTIAYRSRRATLASLAERYGHSVYMEPNPQGGFVLKCADLLEVLWRLENSRSPLAPFHHNMKFNFEYMDECYVKIIAQAHKELSKATIDTEERTFLLSKIIATCLEVRGVPQELNESMESDTESVRVEKRQNIDKETESPEEKRKREANIMAPPKYLPKRAKPKGKENTVENGSKGVKRASSSDGIGSKRAKISDVRNFKSVDNQVDENDGNSRKTDKKANGESEVDNEITELVNKIDGVEQNINNTKKKISKTNKGSEKHNTEENTANNVKKAKATSNNPIPAKTKVNKDNLNAKEPKGDNINNKNVNNNQKVKSKETSDTNTKTKELGIAGTNKKQKSHENLKESNNNNKNVNDTKKVKTKETSDTNTKTKELDIAGTNKKQKSQENLKENNNIKKSTSNKKTVNENLNSVPKNGETTSKIVKKPKTGNKIPENNDNAKIDVGKKKDNTKIPGNQNAESNKGDANTKATKNSKATGKTPENYDENPKNDLAKKSKSENSNKHKTVTKTKANQENNESDNTKAKEVKDGTKTAVNKNIEQLAKPSGKKSVANAKDKANTDVATKNKESNTIQKPTEKVASKNSENKKKPTESNVGTNKNKDNTADVAIGSVASLNRQGSKDSLNNKKIVQNKQISAYKNKPPLKILNKHNMPKKVAKSGSTGTFLKPATSGTFLKPATSGAFLKPVSAEKKDGGKISSKIPQKAISKSVMKKNPLRISPRKMASMFKTPSQLLNQKTQKPSTNIPRLLKNSGTKTNS